MGKHGDYPESWDNDDWSSYNDKLIEKQFDSIEDVYTREKEEAREPTQANFFKPFGGEFEPKKKEPTDAQKQAWQQWRYNGPIDALCYDVNKQIKAITQGVIESEVAMIPTGRKQTQQNNAGGNRGGLNWINNAMLSSDPRTAKILAVRISAPGGKNDFTVKFALNGEIVFWGMRATDREAEKLVEHFGADENNWVDKTVKIYLEQDEFSGGWYKRILIEKETSSRKK